MQPAIVRIAERCGKNDRFIRKTAKLLGRKSVPTSLQRDNACNADHFRDLGRRHNLATVASRSCNAMPDESADAAALHAFRIRAKAVRYTIELVAPGIRTGTSQEVYPIVEELQERLGKVQDHVTARQHIRKWATKRAMMTTTGNCWLS